MVRAALYAGMTTETLVGARRAFTVLRIGSKFDLRYDAMLPLGT